MNRELHYCDRDNERHGACKCQCFACTAAQSQKRHDDAIEAETVAAIVAEVTARRDRAARGRDDIAYGQEKALDALLDWLSDWKR